MSDTKNISSTKHFLNKCKQWQYYCICNPVFLHCSFSKMPHIKIVFGVNWFVWATIPSYNIPAFFWQNNCIHSQNVTYILTVGFQNHLSELKYGLKYLQRSLGIWVWKSMVFWNKHVRPTSEGTQWLFLSHDFIFVYLIFIIVLDSQKLELDRFMLYAHGPDLCRESDLRHAMANCFEALIG